MRRLERIGALFNIGTDEFHPVVKEGSSAPSLLSSAQCAGGENCGAEASTANRHEGEGERDLQQRAGATRAGRYDKSALRGGAPPSI